MTAKKITISVPEDLLDRVAAAVERGDADSVSGYFTTAASWRAAADLWVEHDVREHGPVPVDLLEEARRTLATGELIERRDPSTGEFLRINGSERTPE